jgi:hypothetical protein
MVWLITIKTKTRYSVQLEFDEWPQPTRAGIIRKLHEMFPETHVGLRKELIERVQDKDYVVVKHDRAGSREMRVVG